MALIIAAALHTIITTGTSCRVYSAIAVLNCQGRRSDVARILIIDDDALMRDTIEAMLEDMGHELVLADDGSRAIEAMKTKPADLVITDILMPGKEGIQTICELQQDYPDVPIIAISGGSRRGGESYLPTAAALGAAATLEKPFTHAELIETVERLLVRT